MTLMQLEEPDQRRPDRGIFFSIGFRPFFSFGALIGAALMIIWVLIYRNQFALPQANIFAWHAHEMIFGYGLAIIAGFLLTAVRNWTGLATASGTSLIGLLLIWLSPRILSLVLEPSLWLSLLDLAFVPLLAISLALPIVRSRNWRNLMFVPILFGFFLCNLAYHLSMHQQLDLLATTPLIVALELIMMMITIIGSRVMPMFTRNGSNGQIKPSPRPQLPLVLLGLGLAQILSSFLSPEWRLLQTVLSACFGLGILYAWADWQGKAVWQTPMLWVLHIAYAALGVSYLLKAASLWTLVPSSLWIHSAGVATVGMMTLGFIGRVSLGHSGRALHPSRLMILSYALMLLAALLRLTAAVYPSTGLWDGAALCWALALGLFAFEFIPYLLSPRADGKPS